jgi:predicted nucleic acid-binding protein
LKIFLDTSLLSDSGLSELGEQIVGRVVDGDSFYISVISHFQLLWGYRKAGMSGARYERFLKGISAEVIALTRLDADFASEFKPSSADLLDALIAGSVKRYDASIWTRDGDFLKFLPEAKVRLF